MAKWQDHKMARGRNNYYLSMNATRSIAFKLLPQVARLFPLKLLIRITREKIIFPFYHLVSDEEIPHVKHLYQVRTSREFIHDLDFFLKFYRPIGISDFLGSINKGQSLPGKSFLLSFDDGLREFHDIAVPILLRKGIPAVCFLNSEFIDNKDLFYRYKASLLIERLQNGNSLTDKKNTHVNWFLENHLRFSDDYLGLLNISYANRYLLDELALKLDFHFDEFLLKKRPYLDSAQISSLRQQGFAFGAHSIDHPEYRFLEEEEQIRQTSVSIDLISKRFGIKEKLFSFPFTDHGVKRTFFEKVLNPVSPLADLTFGGAGLKKDSIQRNIQRIPFEGTSLNAKQILGTEYLYYMIKAIFGKNMIRR
jgi:peptidoglycan/xylan/chitin deacetylase (PgdA/CDA1 family)